jgi:hypothetical protein
MLEETHALQEARALVHLLRSGETPTSIRNLIGGDSGYRRSVLAHFDTLIEPEKQIELLLRVGWSQERIIRTLGVKYRTVQQIARKSGYVFQKRGRGRRLSPVLRDQIRQAVRNGMRSAVMQHRFGIDYDTTIKFRNEQGDFENRRHWCKLSAFDQARGEDMLRTGTHWRDVASRLGVALATVQRAIDYRKRRGS